MHKNQNSSLVISKQAIDDISKIFTEIILNANNKKIIIDESLNISEDSENSKSKHGFTMDINERHDLAIDFINSLEIMRQRVIFLKDAGLSDQTLKLIKKVMTDDNDITIIGLFNLSKQIEIDYLSLQNKILISKFDELNSSTKIG